MTDWNMWDQPRYSGVGDAWDTSWATWDGSPWPTPTYSSPAAPPPAPVDAPASALAVSPVVGAPPPPDVAATPGLDPTQQNANSIIQQFLGQVGLGELSDWAWQQIVNGSTPSQIELQLYDPTTTPGKVVDRLYPELQQRRAKNLPPLSIGDAVTYRNNAIQLMRASGLPPTFYDQPDDLAKFAANDVSLAEMKARIDDEVQATMAAPEVTATLAEWGIPASGLTAYYLNPDRALPILERQFQAAQVAAAAKQTGYGNVTEAQASDLASLGVGGQQATQGFGALAAQSELFSALPGEGADTITQDEQLAATFRGDAAASRRIAQRAQSRKAAFAGGGSFAAGKNGLSGLGSAPT